MSANALIPTALDLEIYDWVSVASAIPNRTKIEIAAMAHLTLEKKLDIYNSGGFGGSSIARQRRPSTMSGKQSGVSGPQPTAAALATAEQLRSKLETLLVELRNLPEDVIEDDAAGTAGSDDIFTDPHPDSAEATERRHVNDIKTQDKNLADEDARDQPNAAEGEGRPRESLVVDSKEPSVS